MGTTQSQQKLKPAAMNMMPAARLHPICHRKASACRTCCTKPGHAAHRDRHPNKLKAGVYRRMQGCLQGRTLLNVSPEVGVQQGAQVGEMALVCIRVLHW